MITPGQARMARALLRLALKQLDECEITEYSINRYENMVITLKEESNLKLQRYYEARGVVFTETGVEPIGVNPKKVLDTL
jgi:hypothetical protein